MLAAPPPGRLRLALADREHRKSREQLVGDALLAVAEAADDRSRNQASGVVAAYAQFHLERSLRSLQHVDRSAATGPSRIGRTA